jgi:GDPmannose 4,6-dehydratase
VKTTALITGVTGQDGSVLAEQLLADGWRVVGMARRTSQPSTGNLTRLMGKKHFHLVEGDVTDAGCMHRLVRDVGPDELYNLAAQSFVGASFQEPTHTWAVTAQGALNVLEAVRTERPACRVYQASSSEMFGSAWSCIDDSGQHDEREDYFHASPASEQEADKAFQDEYTPFVPNSPYAIAKLAAHHAVRVYRDSYGLHAVAGILFNHEHQRRGEQFVTRKITRWVGRVVAARQRGEKPPTLTLGNMAARRDWGYAADYMEAAQLMVRAEVPNDYVIATGATWSVREFLDMAVQEAFLPPSVVPELVRMGDMSLRRPNEVNFLRGDSSRARSDLGWAPKVTFGQLVARMVAHDITLAVREAE